MDADVKVVAAVTGSRRALPFELRLIEREFDTMKSLAHPNIVQGSNQHLDSNEMTAKIQGSS